MTQRPSGLGTHLEKMGWHVKMTWLKDKKARDHNGLKDGREWGTNQDGHAVITED